jgi:hypothetical protein
MKQSKIIEARKRHLAAEFENLDYKNQEYIEVLTAQLAEIQETGPEKLSTSGKIPKNIVQQNKEQDK